MARIKYSKGRGFYLTLLIFLIPAGLGVWAYVQWRSEQSLRNAAGSFFNLAQQGRIKNAYESTATSFQDTTSESQLRSFFLLTFPGGVKNWLWTRSRHAPGGETLEGKVWSGDSEVVPVSVTLVRQDARWKVSALEIPTTGLMDAARRAGLPGDKQIAALVAVTMTTLADAQTSRDFNSLHQRLSRAWQQQTTPAMLAVKLRPLTENQVDLASLKGLIPVISRPPHLDTNSHLLVDGYYLPPAGRLNFSLRYAYEHPEWRLAALSFSNE
jgi:hypothetical protein